MAAIYRDAPNHFPLNNHSYAHYTAYTDAALQIQMQLKSTQLVSPTRRRVVPSGSPPPLPPLPPNSPDQSMYNDYGMYSSHPNQYMNSMSPQRHDALFVSPGVPTPVELSIYENKQPTGLLHVTAGNQTVEFLDGVANMPRKR